MVRVRVIRWGWSLHGAGASGVEVHVHCSIAGLGLGLRIRVRVSLSLILVLVTLHYLFYGAVYMHFYTRPVSYKYWTLKRTSTEISKSNTDPGLLKLFIFLPNLILISIMVLTKAVSDSSHIMSDCALAEVHVTVNIHFGLWSLRSLVSLVPGTEVTESYLSVQKSFPSFEKPYITGKCNRRPSSLALLHCKGPSTLPSYNARPGRGTVPENHRHKKYVT